MEAGGLRTSAGERLRGSDGGRRILKLVRFAGVGDDGSCACVSNTGTGQQGKSARATQHGHRGTAAAKRTTRVGSGEEGVAGVGSVDSASRMASSSDSASPTARVSVRACASQSHIKLPSENTDEGGARSHALLTGAAQHGSHKRVAVAYGIVQRCRLEMILDIHTLKALR
jgi:hypothetical protein